MAKDVISLAWERMCCRKFSEAVTLLEAKAEVYENDFEYYIMLAIAFLYIGDFGSASSNLQKARRRYCGQSQIAALSQNRVWY